MWLSLDVKVADAADVTTQRARRSPGRGASRPVVEGWEAAEVTQLWLAEKSPAASLRWFHTFRAAPRSSDPTMKEREHDKDDQESVKEQWGRATMRQTCTAVEWKWLMCGDCKGEAVSTGDAGSHVFIHQLHSGRLFLRTYPLNQTKDTKTLESGSTFSAI